MTDPQLNFFTGGGTGRRAAPGRSKYGNRATGTHASRKEHRRALELQLLERAGHITDLRQQVPFQLIPAQYEQPAPPPCTAPAPPPCTAPAPPPAALCRAPIAPDCTPGPDRASGPSKAKAKAKPRLLERACTYVADFVYIDPATGRQIVEDTKGMRTEVYKIKRKLMLYIHGIQIKET